MRLNLKKRWKRKEELLSRNRDNENLNLRLVRKGLLISRLQAQIMPKLKLNLTDLRQLKLKWQDSPNP